MEAIVLAGGKGTRLRAVVDDVPKPLAPIGGVPFLSFVLEELANKGADRVILSVGYKQDAIVETYGQRYKHVQLDYCSENAPLDTGGAVKACLARAKAADVLVVNGDTLFKADLAQLLQAHQQNDADVTIALRRVNARGRYGAIRVDSRGRVLAFEEKESSASGYINGGVYVIKRDLFVRHAAPNAFSLEKDFLARKLNDVSVWSVPSDAYFIDIGIPEDYQRAQHELLAITDFGQLPPSRPRERRAS